MGSGPEQQHVFYRGTDDHIHHLVWDPVSRKVYTEDWSLRTHAPPSAGDPATMATDGQQHVFYRGRDGQIHHLLWVAAKRRLYRELWTSARGALPAEGDPVTMATPGQQHVFYRGTGGRVCHILCDGSARKLFFDEWTARTPGPLAAGEPATLITDGQQHVFYRGQNGGVQHIFWDPSSNNLVHDDWSSGSSQPLPVGNIATMATGSQKHVFYRDGHGAIQHILWSPVSGSLHRDDWTARARATAADGDPATLLTAEGQQHVFYRAAGGGIGHIFWDPSSPHPRFDDWSSRAHAGVPATGVPATMQVGGQQHVFYQGPGGAIDHILWDPSSPNTLGSDDWTSRSGAPMAAGNPATLVSSDAPADYTWTILPLGDSITAGFPYNQGGYRVGLFATANHFGKRITFVGRLCNGPPDGKVEGVPFPPFHEGFSGKTIDFIDEMAPDALAPQPDIVLLMIGTNDILQNHDPAQALVRLEALLNHILAADLGALLVVAMIPPVPNKDLEVARYNFGVAALVTKLAAAGERVRLADMNTGFSRALMWDDDIHPNLQGYAHIAAVWYAVIDTFLT